ncbi:hypothetical protein SSTG_04280 [Streptomyces sp. e14]|nr:hypothetical protein SSTG_04280 [Streptomyces sp. e14]
MAADGTRPRRRPAATDGPGHSGDRRPSARRATAVACGHGIGLRPPAIAAAYGDRRPRPGGGHADDPDRMPPPAAAPGPTAPGPAGPGGGLRPGHGGGLRRPATGDR